MITKGDLLLRDMGYFDVSSFAYIGSQSAYWLSRLYRQRWEIEIHFRNPWRCAELTLIGSGAILWHAFQKGVKTPLPENSMDVDPVTESEEVAGYCGKIRKEGFVCSTIGRMQDIPTSTSLPVMLGFTARSAKVLAVVFDLPDLASALAFHITIVTKKDRSADGL